MIKELLKYQEVEEKLRGIENDINQSEAAKKYFQAVKFVKEVNDLKASLDKKAQELTIAYKNAIDGLKKITEEVTEISKEIEAIESEEELAYTKKKFLELSDAYKNLESVAKGILKDSEEVSKEFVSVTAKHKEMNTQGRESLLEVNKLKEERKSEMDKLKKELEELAKTVDSDLMEIYLKKRKEKIFPVLSKLSNEKYCSRCGGGLSVGAQNEINKNKMVECESCHRIIYIEE